MKLFFMLIILSFGIFGLILYFLKILMDRLQNGIKTKIPKIDESFYYRDIPCFKNIDYAYWLLYNFSEIKKETLNNGLVIAYLLKWYKDKNVDITESNSSILSNNNYCVDLKDGKWEKNYTEQKIYDFLKKVAGNNNLLEKNEIRNYCKINRNKFALKWLYEDILRNIQYELKEKNYITVVDSKNYIFFKTPQKIILSDEMINEYKNTIGLKNFLLDYSNMQEKIHIEVRIWEDYLIFANLLGIADKVKKQFSKIYPNINTDIGVLGISCNFDDTIVGQFVSAMYIGVKTTFITFLVVALMLFQIFAGNGKIISNLIYIIVLLTPFALVYWFLRKHMINKKIKEMNAITYAKIRDVKVEYSSSDNEADTYFFNYDYTIGDKEYFGSGYSHHKKRNDKRIKIYYNEMHPEKSETAENYNRYFNYAKTIIIMVIIIVLLALVAKS